MYIGLGARGRESRRAGMFRRGGVVGNSLSTGIGRGPVSFAPLLLLLGVAGLAVLKLSGILEGTCPFAGGWLTRILRNLSISGSSTELDIGRVA